MNTTRDQLQVLLHATETILHNQPSGDLYLAWADLANTVGHTIDGFNNVLRAAKATRDAQNAYFKARRGGADRYDSDKLLNDSRKAEKILDDLVTFWTHELSETTPPTQTSLF